ncbi:hypothetical protein SAMN05192533_11790 [Mesobacillus persicus]|uniref:Uncharacterized protein n=1 Tax=Mesobacillus persicus TaxID=930146 RepID=A0A1H8IKM2_9BACI|nr:hypothetical protein [Mesobacillus persicus]SEN69253.1 hypothetical protein SAMN05192533_11790 [Mesobacillus persicus]
MKIDRKTLEIISTISLIVLAISTSIIAIRLDDLIDILTVIGNK